MVYNLILHRQGHKHIQWSSKLLKFSMYISNPEISRYFRPRHTQEYKTPDKEEETGNILWNLSLIEGTF